MTTLQRVGRPNGHMHKGELGSGEAQCPYCGQSVSRKEYKEIQTRIEMEERARIAKIEADLKARVAREVAKAQTQAKMAVEKAKKDANKGAEAKLEAVVTARLQKQREVLEKQKAEAVNAEKLRHAAERLRLESALADLQARLAAKTPHQLGEPAEIDLFESLKAEFCRGHGDGDGGDGSCDVIERVKKGTSGADVIHRVMHGDVHCGTIIYESKAHKRFIKGWLRKLRDNQLEIGADHGVLVSGVIPAGHELVVQDGIVITAPQRVIALAHLLRKQVMQVHTLRLSTEARAKKSEVLYEFINSDRCADIFHRLREAGGDLINLELKEVEQHHTVWRKRGELIRAIQKTNEDLTAAITAIVGNAVETASAEEVAA